MKKAIVVFFSLWILGVAGMANAIPFSSTVDFSTTNPNLDYIIVSDSNSTAYVGLYTHTVTFDPEAASVQSAILRITFANANAILGNGTAKEIWLLYGDTGVQIGELTGSPNLTGNSIGWVTEDFDLSSFISDISGTSWTVAFKFAETTNGTDTFYLDKSVLFGEYTAVAAVDPIVGAESLPVPEPGTIILVSAGLLGLVVINRHKFSKK